MISQQNQEKVIPSSVANEPTRSNKKKSQKVEEEEKLSSSKGTGNKQKDKNRNKVARPSSPKVESHEKLITIQTEESSVPEFPSSQSQQRATSVIDGTSTDSIQFSINATQVGALLFTSQSKVINISGFCTLKLISGKGNINGYRLRPGEEVSIRSPPWIPAIRLFFEATSHNDDLLSKKRFVNELLQSRPYLRPSQQEMTTRLNSSMGIIEVISADLTNENWMIRCEDYSKYQLPVPLLSTAALFLSTAVIGNSTELTQLGLDSHHLPTDWVIAGDLVCKSIKTCPKTVLLGAKGVGKYVIPLVFSLMSYISHSFFLLIDPQL